MSFTLMPFLYQTRTILRIPHRRRASSVVRSLHGVSRRPREGDSIPFDYEVGIPDAKIPTHPQATPGTITPAEREIFERIFADIEAKGLQPMPRAGRTSRASRSAMLIMQQAAHDAGQGRPPTVASPALLAGASKDRAKAILRYPPQLRGAAQKALKIIISQATEEVRHSRSAENRSTPRKDDFVDEEWKAPPHSFARTVEVEAKRYPERTRIEGLILSAKSDFELWDILEKEVFSMPERLGIVKRSAPFSNAKRSGRKSTVKSTDTDINPEFSLSPDDTEFSFNGEEPGFDNSAPSLDGQEPGFNDLATSPSDQEPGFNDVPGLSDQELSASDQVPSDSDPASSDSDPASGASDPAFSVSSQESSLSDPELSTSDEDPSTSDSASSVSGRESSLSDPELGVSDSELSVNDPELSVNDPELSVNDPELNVSDQEPSLSDAESILNAPDVKDSSASPDDVSNPNESAELSLYIHGPLYPAYLLLALRRLDTAFHASSPLVFSVLPRIKELGLESYVLGVSTPFYNELLEIYWKRYGNLAGMLDLLEEMKHCGLYFDKRTAAILGRAQAGLHQLVGPRAVSGFGAALMRMPEYERSQRDRIQHWHKVVDISAQEKVNDMDFVETVETK